jgi:hypothetical protein
MSTITRLYLQAMVTKKTSDLPFVGSGVATDVVLGAGDSAGASPSEVATLVIHVAAFDGTRARLQVTDSADNFSSDKLAAFVAHIQGKLGQAGVDGAAVGGDQVIRVPWYDIVDARFGVTSSKMRVELVAVAGETVGIKYESWIEY